MLLKSTLLPRRGLLGTRPRTCVWGCHVVSHQVNGVVSGAIDALNITQYRTDSQVSQAISDALMPYYTSTEADSAIASNSVDLSNYYTRSHSRYFLQNASPGNVSLGLSVDFCLFVAIAVDLQRVSVVLQAGAQGPGEVQIPQHVGAFQDLPGGRIGAPSRRVRQGHRRQSCRDGCVCLRRGVIGRQVDASHGVGNLGIHLRGCVILHQGCGDGRVRLCRGAVGRQCCCNGGVSLCSRFIRNQGGSYRRICLRETVRVAGQAQVNPSFCRLTLRGALKCKLRRVLVPRSKSQVISPDQACA